MLVFSFFGRVILLILNNELWIEVICFSWDSENLCRILEVFFFFVIVMVEIFCCNDEIIR